MTAPKIYLQKGFSIIEIILIVLIAGFIALLMTSLPNSLGLVGSSRHEAIAREIAVKKIEELRATPYDSLGGDGTTPIIDTRLATLPNGTAQLILGQCDPAICTRSEEIRTVTVKIDWIEIKNNLKSVQIDTLIAKNGLK